VGKLLSESKPVDDPLLIPALPESAFDEGLGILPVDIPDVCCNLFLEEIHKIKGNTEAAGLEIFLEIGDFLDKCIVFHLVRKMSGIVKLLHELFLRLEVVDGIGCKLLECRFQHLFSLSAFHGIVKVVDKSDELLVLVVNLFDLNTQFIIPCHEWHAFMLPYLCI
jgi:hypothetical protein